MRMTMQWRAGAAALALALALGATPTAAKTFRWANDGDANSMDPYYRNETFLLTFMANVYEPLVRRDRGLKMEPGLAVKWSQPDPKTWRFELRKGVSFHDGAPFNADDVVFSYGRALESNLKGYFQSVQEVKKIDDYTVDFITKTIDPILPDQLTTWGIMSKRWAEANNATKVAQETQKEENFATRNANGTGPFMLKSREPDVKTVFVPNPKWWDKAEHNLTEVVFNRIPTDGTRIAALLSGEIDMVYTVPPQDQERLKKDPNIVVVEGPELRTIFLGFDQLSPELRASDVKGKNPYKDVRVRKAFYQAIDIETIKTKVMRGLATPSALMIAPAVNGHNAKLNVRFPYNPDAAKKLLAEAGYANGFETGMDCPTDRYVNDEAICQAVVAMLARVGIKVNLLAQTRAKYFAKINQPKYDTDFYLLGWTPNTFDVHNALSQLMYNRGSEGKGLYNIGGYNNARVNELTDLISSEPDRAKRQALIDEAMKIHHEEVGHVPLHQQALVWAMRKNISLAQMADNYFPLRFVKVGN